MRPLALLLCLCVPAGAAPRLPDRSPDRYDRMTPEQLFHWAFTAPKSEKPWRVISRIEKSQKDPVAWAWRVNAAMEEQLCRHFPRFDDTTPWRQWIEYMATADPNCPVPTQPVPGEMAHLVWKVRMRNGDDCEYLFYQDW